jgi:drug/metabolite transporter (DMT)-like permease
VTAKILAGLVAMISCTVVANIFMKLGAGASSSERWLSGIAGSKTIAGMAFFLCAMLIYAWLLTKMPLNLAQSLASAQFISVILASSIVLAEPIPNIRWLGIALITAGIVIVGYSADGTNP